MFDGGCDDFVGFRNLGRAAEPAGVVGVMHTRFVILRVVEPTSRSSSILS